MRPKETPLERPRGLGELAIPAAPEISRAEGRKPVPTMQFSLNKNQTSTLLEQAREQLLAALHTGKLRAGDRLPSVRQMVLQSNINIKTALSIYQRLQKEGYLDLRAGSGAYVADIEAVDLEQAYCLSILRLVRSHVAQAGQLKLDPKEYSGLVQRYVEKSRLDSACLAVVECNEEQINVFSSEILNRLNVRVYPMLVSQLASRDRCSGRLLARMDYFATTHFHFRQVKALVSPYGKKLLHLQLNPRFIPELVAAAHCGSLLMIVSNTSYFPAFRRALLDLGTPKAVVERISAVDDTDLGRVRAAAATADAVYVSPICNPAVCGAVPSGKKRLRFDSILSRDSIDMLEAVMLFHPHRWSPAPGRHEPH